jgi:hypothetical protein
MSDAQEAWFSFLLVCILATISGGWAATGWWLLSVVFGVTACLALWNERHDG